jgi:hypothetical protein
MGHTVREPGQLAEVVAQVIEPDSRLGSNSSITHRTWRVRIKHEPSSISRPLAAKRYVTRCTNERSLTR